VTRSLVVVLALLASSCDHVESAGSAMVQPGTPAPTSWAAAEGVPTLVWAVTPDQLIACETAAYELRSIERQHRRAVRFAIVSTHENQALLREFIAQKRLTHLPVTLLSSREFHATFPSDAPYMVIVRNGVVVETIRADKGSLRDPSFHQRLERALSEHDLQVTNPLSPTHRSRGA
jgi:hypothetical protein